MNRLVVIPVFFGAQTTSRSGCLGSQAGYMRAPEVKGPRAGPVVCSSSSLTPLEALVHCMLEAPVQTNGATGGWVLQGGGA